jgi:hypothetical protein
MNSSDDSDMLERNSNTVYVVVAERTLSIGAIQNLVNRVHGLHELPGSNWKQSSSDAPIAMNTV